MKSSANKISLISLDDIFKTTDLEKDNETEKVYEIPISELHSFNNHPFQVKDDEQMQEMVNSIKEYGVLVPCIVRIHKNSGYEIISGHRRKRASELAGKETIPAIIMDLTDDESIIIMVDTNLQREIILPSEKAFAYKMKLEAIKHQGKISGQIGTKSREIIAEDTGDSGRQIQRYIRLTELIPPLLKMVDNEKLSFGTSVELSYLKNLEQEILLKYIEMFSVYPSINHAQQLKKHSQEKEVTTDIIKEVLSVKTPKQRKLIFTNTKLKEYFPISYTTQQIESTIIELLQNWKKTIQH